MAAKRVLFLQKKNYTKVNRYLATHLEMYVVVKRPQGRQCFKKMCARSLLYILNKTLIIRESLSK